MSKERGDRIAASGLITDHEQVPQIEEKGCVHEDSDDDRQSTISIVSTTGSGTGRFPPLDFDLDIIKTEPAFIRLRDKFTFFVGTFDALAIAFLCGGYQFAMPFYYTVKLPLLVMWRFYRYRSKSWHYFLLDFCYFGNALLLVYLWIVPHSAELFVVVFAVCNGPLAWAILPFSNAMVFHSVDKITSLLIHLIPPVVTYCIRWFSPTVSSNVHHDTRYWLDYEVCMNDECEADFIYLLGYPLAYVCAHQLIYFLVIQVWQKKKIEENSDALTTYRYLFRKREGTVYRIISVFGAKFRIYCFGLFFVAFAGLTMLPSYILYHYQEAHILLICFVTAVSVWNGGTYYVDIFASCYSAARPRREESE